MEPIETRLSNSNNVNTRILAVKVGLGGGWKIIPISKVYLIRGRLSSTRRKS